MIWRNPRCKKTINDMIICGLSTSVRIINQFFCLCFWSSFFVQNKKIRNYLYTYMKCNTDYYYYYKNCVMLVVSSDTVGVVVVQKVDNKFEYTISWCVRENIWKISTIHVKKKRSSTMQQIKSEKKKNQIWEKENNNK